MNKTEYRKHCEEQIEKCIKLNDAKHLKEHELSLALLNENESLINNKNNLIKYLENKINMCDGYIDTTRSDLEEVKYTLFAYDNLKKSIEENIKARNIYQDLLERIKNNNYE
ncbi:MAG: hypothetical protein HFI86_02150 [Bacilli bacterium]|nr:hypothetical protein [Bacilli bacterium]